MLILRIRRFQVCDVVDEGPRVDVPPKLQRAYRFEIKRYQIKIRLVDEKC